MSPELGSNHCAGIVRTSIERLKSVVEVDTNSARRRVRVVVEDGAIEPAELPHAVENAGYEVSSVRGEDDDKSEDGVADEAYLAAARKNLWIGMIPAALIMLLMAPHMLWAPIPGYLVYVVILAIPTVFWAGCETHLSAFRSLRNRTANLDVSWWKKRRAPKCPCRSWRIVLPLTLFRR